MMRTGMRRFRSQDSLLFRGRSESRSPSATPKRSRSPDNTSQQGLSTAAGSHGGGTESSVAAAARALESTFEMGCCTMHCFAAVSITVSPITLFLQLYSLDYYERQGAYLPVLAYFITLTRGLDVLFAPLMMCLTDFSLCLKSWGRRKPYLGLGCGPCAIALCMLLFPPFDMVTKRSSASISLWYGATFLIFNLLQALVVAPYEAMASEVTHGRRERKRLFFLSLVYDGLGALVTTSLPLLMDVGFHWLPKGACSAEENTTASCDVLNNRIRFGVIGLVFGGAIVLTNLLVVNLVRERPGVGTPDSAVNLGGGHGVAGMLGGLGAFEVKTTGVAVRRMPRRRAPTLSGLEEGFSEEETSDEEEEEDDDDDDDEDEEDDDAEDEEDEDGDEDNNDDEEDIDDAVSDDGQPGGVATTRSKANGLIEQYYSSSGGDLTDNVGLDLNAGDSAEFLNHVGASGSPPSHTLNENTAHDSFLDFSGGLPLEDDEVEDLRDDGADEKPQTGTRDESGAVMDAAAEEETADEDDDDDERALLADMQIGDSGAENDIAERSGEGAGSASGQSSKTSRSNKSSSRRSSSSRGVGSTWFNRRGRESPSSPTTGSEPATQARNSPPALFRMNAPTSNRSPRARIAAAKQQQEQQRRLELEEQEVTCPECSSLNAFDDENCADCGAVLHEQSSPLERVPSDGVAFVKGGKAARFRDRPLKGRNSSQVRAAEARPVVFTGRRRRNNSSNHSGGSGSGSGHGGEGGSAPVPIRRRKSLAAVTRARAKAKNALKDGRRRWTQASDRRRAKRRARAAEEATLEVGILNVPMVPAVLSMLRNRAFAALLPAWVCDSMAAAMTMSMLVFYVRYVLQPEQQTLETDGIECRAYFWAARGDLGGYLAGGFGMPQEPDNEGEDLGSANEVPAGWVDDDDQFNGNATYSSLVDEFGIRRLGRRPGPYAQIPWRCKSASVLSAMACAMLVGSFVGGPLWAAIAKRVETRNAWLLWSMAVAFNHLVLGFADKGDVYLAVALAFIVGVPYGARHLNDTIVSDIMDYDEFITGMRNEAFFTVSKSFLPRLAAAPAAALPVALLGPLGHRPPIDGSIQPQSPDLVNFCKAMTVYVPAFLSLMSLVLKTRYPLRTKEQIQMVRDGIKLHRMTASRSKTKMNDNDDEDHHHSSFNNHSNTMAGSSEKYHHNSNGDPHVDLNRPPATGGAAVAVAATSTSVADSNSLGAPLTSSSSSTIFVGDSDQQTPLAQGRSSSSLGRQRHRRGSSSQDLEDSDPVFLASVASAEAKLEGVARRANPSRSPTRHRPSSPSSSPLDPPSSHQPQSQPSEGALKPLPLSAPLHALGDKTGSSDTYWADGLNDVLHHTFDVNYERKSGNTSRNSDGVGVGSVSYNPMNNSSNIRGGGFINGGGISSSSGGMSMNSAGAARAAKATATSSPSMSSGAAGLSPVAPPPEPQSAAAAAWGLGVVLPQPATDPITRMPYRPLLTGLTHTEQRLLFTLLTFPQVKVLRDLRANGPGPLVRRMATYSLLTGALSIGLFALSIWSLRYLSTEHGYKALSLVATLSATAFGNSLILSVYSYMRHQTAKELMKSDDVSFRLLDIAIAQMELQHSIRNARIRYKVRLAPTRRPSRRSLTQPPTNLPTKGKKTAATTTSSTSAYEETRNKHALNNRFKGGGLAAVATAVGAHSIADLEQEKLQGRLVSDEGDSWDGRNYGNPPYYGESHTEGEESNEEGAIAFDDDEGFGFAPRFVRDNLCYQCSLHPSWYLLLAWRCSQVVSLCVVAVGAYLCIMYHTPESDHAKLVPVSSYITLWNGLLATGFCFWPSNAVHNPDTRNKRSPEDLGFFLGAMFVFSNMTMLLSKLLHSTADQPVADWEDKVPLNAAAVVSFLLGACITSVIAILFVFLSDFMADPVDDGSDDDEGQSLRDEVGDQSDDESIWSELGSLTSDFKRWVKSKYGSYTGPRSI